MSAPTFSVLVPAYNAAATVAAALRSALAQTRPDFEVIVVDDGSTDATPEVVRPFLEDPRVALLRQENRGLAGARNTALEHASGRYVSLLDADDLLLPDYLERMATALASDPEAAFAYGDAWVFDDATKRIRRASAMAYMRPPVPPPQDPHAFLLELLDRNFIFVAATIRRAVLEEVGPFDASLRSAEDYELWLRIALRGYRAVRVEGPVALYRLRPGQLSADPLNMLRHLRDVYRLVAGNPDAPDEVRAAAREQAKRMEREAATVSGERRLRALRYRSRLRLGRVKRALIGRWLWYDRPPPQVAAAFPDLEAL